MTLFFRIHWQSALALIFGLGFAGGFGFVPAQADEWNKKTVLTVNDRIQVTDTVLDPGKYVLLLADSSSDRHIVRIYNENQTHLIDTVMAIPNYRLQPTGKSNFTFWETPPGTAPALRAWFYPGDNFGQEFRYPKHPLALEASAATPPPPVARTEPPPPPEVTPQAPQANNQPASQEPQAEVAQNTPPPAAAAAPPPAPSQEANREEQTKPQELPKTASPYPAIGLAGGVLLALAGLLKLRQLV
jgi:hypothetical protein